MVGSVAHFSTMQSSAVDLLTIHGWVAYRAGLESQSCNILVSLAHLSTRQAGAVHLLTTHGCPADTAGLAGPS